MNRIKELNDVAALAFESGDFDMLEQLFQERQDLLATQSPELENSLAEVHSLDNHYCNHTPVAQIISDHLMALVQYYSREIVLGYFNDTVKLDQSQVMLSVHFSNLFQTYGTESVDEVMSWIDFKS